MAWLVHLAPPTTLDTPCVADQHLLHLRVLPRRLPWQMRPSVCRACLCHECVSSALLHVACVQAFVDRGGDITTPEMVVEALLSNPLRNTMVALVDFDTARLMVWPKSWPGRR